MRKIIKHNKNNLPTVIVYPLMRTNSLQKLYLVKLRNTGITLLK